MPVSAGAPHGLAARTSSGVGPVMRLPKTQPTGKLAVLVEVTAVSGTTPSLTVEVLWGMTPTGTFVAASPADALPALTTAGGVVKVFDAKAPFYRLSYTIAGTTPSVTFRADSMAY